MMASQPTKEQIMKALSEVETDNKKSTWRQHDLGVSSAA